MLTAIIIYCILLICLLVGIIYIHEKPYDEPDIEPDPMEDRIAEIKYRINRQKIIGSRIDNGNIT